MWHEETMTHAILGAGGVGGLIAAALAAGGSEVTLLVRSSHPPRVELERPGGELVRARVGVATRLEAPVAVLWIAVKAVDLAEAIAALPDAPAPTIVPLLNGIDHVDLLRARFGRERVVPATIRVEAERIAPGRIRVSSPFVRLDVAASGAERLEEALIQLRAFGFACGVEEDERTLLWSKLAFLAPFALATTAAAAPIGDVVGEPHLDACAAEACAVGIAEGATLDATAVQTAFRRVPGAMRSSMQKDVAAGRVPELDAIAGPIVRGAAKHGIEIPATRELVARVAARVRG
jgi:2-dehydropantoate 2-reductase